MIGGVDGGHERNCVKEFRQVYPKANESAGL